MANMFALILVIATLVTGILWCVDKFFFAPKRRERQAAAHTGVWIFYMDFRCSFVARHLSSADLSTGLFWQR